MTLVHRVLYPRPIISLDDYLVRGGGKGLQVAERIGSAAIIDRVLESGLRGRGGAGFLTGRKWQTVAENHASMAPTTVIVNAAEGEPGTFKDRTILRRNPYLVLEGALIAARAVGADYIIFAMKRVFVGEIDRMRAAIEEAEDAGWSEGITMVVFEGPDEYLYGEESALLETIDGRWPFPRVVPTFRRGLRGADRIDSADEAPALVNNTETLANVARIAHRGPAWFRTAGTHQSPGTMVCTVTGTTRRAGVGEVNMGTPLREVIAAVGGGPRKGHEIKAVLSGVANRVRSRARCSTLRPVSYEGMAAIGSGLGSAAFIVLDDTVDMTAVAAGVARFLSVESCGQCSPCKLDEHPRRPSGSTWCPSRMPTTTTWSRSRSGSAPSPIGPVASWPPSSRSCWRASSSSGPRSSRPTWPGPRRRPSRRSSRSCSTSETARPSWMSATSRSSPTGATRGTRGRCPSSCTPAGYLPGGHTKGSDG